ncbi:uncharacterized protein LOC112556621 [Pomacea canaliculata]|uniref:uncharacterized protein LOC112556621 n=1 Tax=Pomacea canaliculata TaxID=400727 RepID=UPI000D73C8EB|nr:uncharacterized protein LOC112556621 [Pomacea canaliculata]XP_025081572.1 uncharacterized protein LOC112556621 [Pomacea canaliculata]XP_025081573.1 uncharacterized protein LOC112556621 [Pomacea canaliculata]
MIQKKSHQKTKKKRTAAGGKKTTIGAKTRTPAALGAAINSLARIRKTATSGQSKTTLSREMNRKHKAEDQFKDDGFSTRNKYPPKISAVEENAAVGEVLSLKNEPLDPEYYLNAGELPSPTEAILDLKPVFLREAEPECAHSQQCGKNIKEEFEIELNPDWCPDDDKDERTMPLGDIKSRGLKEDAEPLGGEYIESWHAGKVDCTLVTLGDPEMVTWLPTTEGLEQNTTAGSKCAAQPQSKPDGLKAAVASDKENGGTDVELPTLSRNDLTESVDCEQSSNVGEQQTVTPAGAHCTVVAAVDASDGSGRGGTAAVLAGVAGASSEETYFTETSLARHEVLKMLLATTPVGALPVIAHSSKPTFNGSTGQTLLPLTSNGTQQSFTGHSPRNASSQSIIVLTSPSSDCSSQKLLFVPSTCAQNSVSSGHTIVLLNPSSSEQIPSERTPGGCGDQKTNIFLCQNCGNKIVGQDMLRQHLLRCPMSGSLGLSLPPGPSQTSAVIVSQTDQRPILPKEIVVVVSPKAPVPQAHGVLTNDEGSTGEASETHLEVERPFKCDHCYSRHQKLSHLRIHVVRAHGKPDPLLCPVCGRQFQKQSTFNIHVNTHSSDTPFACPQCPKAYKSAATLKSHLRQHTGERPYQCPICSRLFSELQHVKRHQLTHTRDGPLKCPECPATFLVPSSYKIHLRVHTGERPFPCHLCEKAFRDRSALNVHLRIHTRENPHQCQVCGATFQSSGGLKQHTLGHVGISPYECQRCGVTCGSRGALKRHMRFHSRTTAADAQDDDDGVQASEAASKPSSRSQHRKRRGESEKEEDSVKRREEIGALSVMADDTLTTSSLGAK